MNDQPIQREERQTSSAHDPEAAQRALARVEQLLDKQRRVEALVHREQAPDDQKKELVELLVQRRHSTELKAILDRLHPADIAYILEALPINERLTVWDGVKADRDGEILIEVSDAVRETLIASMNRDELVDAVESLEADEIASIADDLPADVVDEVREGLTSEERAQLRASMSYPDDSVGALMDFEMITIRENVTLEVVLRYLRRFDALPNHTDQVFVVDRHEVLKGGLPLDRSLLNEPEVQVASVMNTDLMTLSPLDETSEAAQAFERYDLVSAPVVDEAGRLVGRLTVDEVVDVIREEGEDAALAQAGLLEEEDLFASVWNSARNRWLWLAVNLFTAFFASRVIGAFESTIERVVALATLMTIVMGIAGNPEIRHDTDDSLACARSGDRGNARRLILKELVIAGLNGLVWGSIAGLVAWWIYVDSPRGWLIGLTLLLAMTLNMVIGSLVGMFLPLMLVKSGRDPALGSSVLLTFTTDSMGVFIFLGLATLFFL